MTDKLNDSIHRLLARPGLHSVRFFRRGSEVHVEGYSNDIVKVPQGVIVADGGERTLADAVDCLAAQAWHRGDPPDQLAEADAHAGRDPYSASPEQFHTGLIRDREKAEKEADAYLERAIAAEARADKADARVAELRNNLAWVVGGPGGVVPDSVDDAVLCLMARAAVSVARGRVVELEERIENALSRANGRFCEWGERAEMVEAILRGEEVDDG